MAKLPDLFGRGVIASRPAAGIAGRHYHATDSIPPTTYRDNGSSWDSEATAGMAAVTTTRGDLIVRGVAVDGRLAVGAANTGLFSDGTDPSWRKGLPADLDFSADNTTQNATNGHHGLLPKLSNVATEYLDGSGVFSTPAGGGGGGGAVAYAGAKAYSNATQAITTGGDRVITFNAENWDTDGYHESVTNPGRFTIPAGKGGKYLVVAHLYGLSSNNHDVRFRVNGASLFSDVLYTATAGAAITISAELALAAGDYVEVVVNPGANVTVGHATAREAQNDMSVSLLGGYSLSEVAYAEITTTVSVTGTSQGSPTDVVAAAAFTADGTSSYKVEFYSPFYRVGASALLFVDLWLDGSVLCHLFLAGSGSIVDHYAAGAVVARKVTPAAGARTYSVKAYRATANGEVGAGNGAAGDYAPAYIRITAA